MLYDEVVHAISENNGLSRILLCGHFGCIGEHHNCKNQNEIKCPYKREMQKKQKRHRKVQIGIITRKGELKKIGSGNGRVSTGKQEQTLKA